MGNSLNFLNGRFYYIVVCIVVCGMCIVCMGIVVCGMCVECTGIVVCGVYCYMLTTRTIN